MTFWNEEIGIIAVLILVLFLCFGSRFLEGIIPETYNNALTAIACGAAPFMLISIGYTRRGLVLVLLSVASLVLGAGCAREYQRIRVRVLGYAAWVLGFGSLIVCVVKIAQGALRLW